MIRRSLLGLLASLLVTALGVEPARSQQTNHKFPSSHPLLLNNKVHLTAALIKPKGAGPFPAVVMLHGCGGIQESLYQLASRFVSWGYIAVVPDSLGPRRIKETCPLGVDGKPGWDAKKESQRKRVDAAARVFDVIDTINYLATLSYVDRERTAVAGWSHGGEVVLIAAKVGELSDAKAIPKAFVAFYPGCRDLWDSVSFSAPLIILVGDKDQVSPHWHCKTIVENRKSKDVYAETVVYKGAYHSFVVPGANYHKNYWTGKYDESAAADAMQRIKRLLATAFSS